MNKVRLCPICDSEYTSHPAISRRDNKTEICPACGQVEALAVFIKSKSKKGDEDA